MRALIIGADGFVGRWLVRHLLESGDVVTAIVGPRYRPPLDGVDAVHQLDVREYPELTEVVAAASPEAVYYLAAVSQASSREQVVDAARIGLVGPIHALTACSALNHAIRLVHVSSAHVYGDGGSDPVSESAPVQPSNVYGAAKAASEQALLLFGPAAGVDVVIARPFNHIGPGQGSSFVVPSLVSQFHAIRRGERKSVRIGGPSMVRDYSDVRDVVRAYRILATTGAVGGIYNVASGRGTSVAELVRMLTEATGINADVLVDEGLARARETPVLIGDAIKLEALGWTPSYALRETLSDILATDP